MTQTQVQLPEEMEKVIKNIKEFFESRKLNFITTDIVLNKDDEEDKTTYFSFVFEKLIKIPMEEFNKLVGLLKEMGLRHVNEGKNVINKLTGSDFKIWEKWDIYMYPHEKKFAIFLKYIWYELNGEITIILERVSIIKGILTLIWLLE